mmetsp:Transcript_43995/g.99398  ORF Transcript_43995/g.99398 Transcript_43995/m.99398 type:complete len:255 (+) Transcript_43995:1011-1775(+)
MGAAWAVGSGSGHRRWRLPGSPRSAPAPVPAPAPALASLQALGPPWRCTTRRLGPRPVGGRAAATGWRTVSFAPSRRLRAPSARQVQHPAPWAAGPAGSLRPSRSTRGRAMAGALQAWRPLARLPQPPRGSRPPPAPAPRPWAPQLAPRRGELAAAASARMGKIRRRAMKRSTQSTPFASRRRGANPLERPGDPTPPRRTAMAWAQLKPGAGRPAYRARANQANPAGRRRARRICPQKAFPWVLEGMPLRPRAA